MATSSYILTWEISWTEEPGGLQFMGRESQTRLKYKTTTTIHWIYTIYSSYPSGIVIYATFVECQLCTDAILSSVNIAVNRLSFHF